MYETFSPSFSILRLDPTVKYSCWDVRLDRSVYTSTCKPLSEHTAVLFQMPMSVVSSLH